ncbi:MAG: hypothetical protein WC609_01715 [Candidatus Paceibacterota bacterium]|jgi:hypothetical protein
MIVLLAVVAVIFIKIYAKHDFFIRFPEDCDTDSNTCVEIDGELSPTRFVLLRENYFLQNCDSFDFNQCLEKCQNDGACSLKVEEDNQEENQPVDNSQPDENSPLIDNVE